MVLATCGPARYGGRRYRRHIGAFVTAGRGGHGDLSGTQIYHDPPDRLGCKCAAGRSLDFKHEERAFFNNIPTSFVLSDEQVDRQMTPGGKLLHKNPEFRRFLSDVGQSAARRPACRHRIRRGPPVRPDAAFRRRSRGTSAGTRI